MSVSHGALFLLPLSLIDEPEIPMRESMDEAALVELAESIKQHGLVEPVIVRAHLDRFVVIAGHRRTLASRRAGLGDIPCIVRDVDAVTVERLKIAENNDREDVNPAEEASYLAQLLERFCHNDTDELAQFTGRSRQYVETRLGLLLGHPLVLEAVKSGQISMAVGHELNRFPDEVGLKMHLENARTGATAKLVRRWLTDYTAFRANNPADAPPPPSRDAPLDAAPIAHGPICPVCEVDEERPRLVPIYVHDYCNKAVLQKLLKVYRGEGASVGS